MVSRWRTVLMAMTALIAFSALKPACGQISEGGTPPSFTTTFSGVIPTVQMPAVDAQAYLAEDATAGKDEPYRFAAQIDVKLDLQTSGTWTTLPDGSRLWRLRVSSPGAYSLCFLYDHWFIPKGGKLWVYNDDRSRVIGAFTEFNNWKDGTNITFHVAGDASTIEYLEPADVNGQTVLSIWQVVHAYRNLFGFPSATTDFGQSGSCNNNVMCPEAFLWQNQKRGVGMIISNGSRLCSGSLVNNTSPNPIPYFLTANHCYSGSFGPPASWIFVFNYESPACSPTTDGPTTQTIANATLRARWSTSDFCLMELSSAVPQSYNPYYNGWNKVDAASTNSTCIHHPNADVKKISWDYNAPVSSGYYGSGSNHWNIVAWDDGTTEPGSSGSPLFDQNHRVTGQLHGGDATCSNNVNDFFGKFATSWAGGGSSSNRLSNWLDPASTGASTLDGLEGAAFGLQVWSPNGSESWTSGQIDTIKWVSRGPSETVIIELNRTYPGVTWESIVSGAPNTGTYAWTVTGPGTTTARVRIRGTTHTTTGDSSNANFTIIATTPSIIVTTPNGGENWLVTDNNTIQWTSANLSENVKIELNRGYPGVTWETIIASTGNTGSYVWPVTGPVTTTARIRIRGTVQTAVGDTSDANFTIGARSLTVTAPNGGENWLVADNNTIQWTSANLAENVKIEVNRSYSGPTWETIIANTSNTGSYVWPVTGPATGSARVRITGVTHTLVGDTSDANFAIAARSVLVQVPNGGENWTLGEFDTIRWTSAYMPENVKIELNRTYPGVSWDVLTASVSNTGSYPWIVSGATSTTSRVRITGVTHTTVGDSSDANFTIHAQNVPPTLFHNALHDMVTGSGTVVALATDPSSLLTVVSVKMFYRLVGTVTFDSLALAPDGYPDEFMASLAGLAAGNYEYYVRALDNGGLFTVVPAGAPSALYTFTVGALCGGTFAYDDGSAESFNWADAAAAINTQWAVKYSVPIPFVLCGMEFAAARTLPDTIHTPVHVYVYAADGTGGLPGTLLQDGIKGSIGNVIGGLPSGTNWAQVILRDDLGGWLVINSPDFYVAVSNITLGQYEAFGRDSTGGFAHRSYYYDPCQSRWFSEDDLSNSNGKPGNRMIRMQGFSLLPPGNVVISTSGDDVILHWSDTGAPRYHVYSSLTLDGPYSTDEGTSPGSSFTDVGGSSTSVMKFYQVRAELP